MIFNYGYGCCTFAHNIYWSKPWIPATMPDTSKSLSPDFFINLRCPLSAALRVPTTDPDANIREELPAESLPAAENGLGTQLDSPARVAGENEEPDASNEN